MYDVDHTSFTAAQNAAAIVGFENDNDEEDEPHVTNASGSGRPSQRTTYDKVAVYARPAPAPSPSLMKVSTPSMRFVNAAAAAPPKVSTPPSPYVSVVVPLSTTTTTENAVGDTYVRLPAPSAPPNIVAPLLQMQKTTASPTYAAADSVMPPVLSSPTYIDLKTLPILSSSFGLDNRTPAKSPTYSELVVSSRRQPDVSAPPPNDNFINIPLSGAGAGKKDYVALPVAGETSATTTTTTSPTHGTPPTQGTKAAAAYESTDVAVGLRLSTAMAAAAAAPTSDSFSVGDGNPGGVKKTPPTYDTASAVIAERGQ